MARPVELPFTKMHGLGNDFMVIDHTSNTTELTPAQIQAFSNRHTGIGFDQLLVVSHSPSAGVDFRYQIFNADGGEVEQCGNGARCFARFVQDKQLTDKSQIVVETNTGIITLHVQDDGQVTVDMGAPIVNPADIPFVAEQPATTYSVPTQQGPVTIGAISMGNPHGVLVVDDVDTADVEGLGPELEKHAVFPNRANIGFMQIVSRQHIRLRVFERGVGETQACGTGACAAAVAAIQQGLIDNTVTVSLPGGDLVIEWHPHSTHDHSDNAGHVMMTGPATTVYEGTISL